MKCRNCGTEIADKAIVCYRCGTGTKEPLRKPAEIRRRRTPLWLVIAVILVIILLGLLLARNYQIFGLDLWLLDPPSWSAVLIDFPPGNA